MDISSERIRLAEVLKRGGPANAGMQGAWPRIGGRWLRATVGGPALLGRVLDTRRWERVRQWHGRRAGLAHLRRIATGAGKPILAYVVPYDVAKLQTGGARRIAGIAGVLANRFRVCILSLSPASRPFSVRAIAPDVWMAAIPASAAFAERCAGGRAVWAGAAPLFAFSGELAGATDFRAALDALQPRTEAWAVVSPLAWPPLRDRIAAGAPLIYDAHDDALSFLRDVLGCRAADALAQAEAAERDLAERATAAAFCTDADRAATLARIPALAGKAVVVPNGVAGPACAFVPPTEARAARRRAGLSRPVAVFMGAGYRPNCEAAEAIVRTLAPALPEVVFIVLGLPLAGFLDFGGTEPGANVLWTGPVPEETKAAVFALADVALAPMKSGTGSSLKIPEYVAHGKLVVGTPVGLRGFAALGAFESVIAADDVGGALAQVLARLEQDPAAFDPACRAAREWIDRNLDWSVAAQPLGAALDAAG
jgi:glycosyltransferase involved in cell wall biosynthesis